MASLSEKDKRTLEELFGMSTGYVLEFSNPSFARFVAGVVSIDIYNGPGYTEYCSKANKLRQIWTEEPDQIVGTLIDELLDVFEEIRLRKNGTLSDFEKKKLTESRVTAQRLKGGIVKVDLPIEKEESRSILLEDINRSLEAGQPTLVLDRLHTYSTKFLQKVCSQNGINILDDKGHNLPLHSLAGMLRKFYDRENTLQSRFTLLAIQNSISLFEQFNDIRNKKSYAHANDLLDTEEAMFVLKIMTDFLVFIEKVEKFRTSDELLGKKDQR